MWYITKQICKFKFHFYIFLRKKIKFGYEHTYTSSN